MFCKILGAYFLALACMPCSDGEHAHAADTGSQWIVAQYDGGGNSHEHCSDQCSPFCVCTCCGSISTQIKNVTTAHSVEPDAATRRAFGYQAPLSDNHSPSLLRPPAGVTG